MVLQYFLSPWRFGGSLPLERFHFRDVADPLFMLAIAATVWYAAIGPAILAVVLSGLPDMVARTSPRTFC